nr:hypothetical protein GCM10020063_055420 [Dactylosporangium thailandense]
MSNNLSPRAGHNSRRDLGAVVALCNALAAAIGAVYIATTSAVATAIAAASVTVTAILALRRRYR